MYILARFWYTWNKMASQGSCILLCTSLQFHELSFQCFVYYHTLTNIPLWSTVIFSRYIKYGTYVNNNRREKTWHLFQFMLYIYIHWYVFQMNSLLLILLRVTIIGFLVNNFKSCITFFSFVLLATDTYWIQ